MEYDASGNVKKKYVYALGRCIAFIDSAGGKHYLHHDALGSVRVITNSSGNAENTYRYYPFGSSLSASETVTNDLKFTEKPLVDGMNCYDYSARYYDPEIARFYALDPMPSGGSPYAYCYNNPLLYIDPSGMTTFSQAEIDAEQVGVGGGGGSNFASWYGSMRSFMAANPEFHNLVSYNTNTSEQMFNYARNDYFRGYNVNQGSMTEKYWNAAFDQEGTITRDYGYVSTHEDAFAGLWEAQTEAWGDTKGYDVAMPDPRLAVVVCGIGFLIYEYVKWVESQHGVKPMMDTHTEPQPLLPPNPYRYPSPHPPGWGLPPAK